MIVTYLKERAATHIHQVSVSVLVLLLQGEGRYYMFDKSRQIIKTKHTEY